MLSHGELFHGRRLQAVGPSSLMRGCDIIRRLSSIPYQFHAAAGER